MNRPRIRPTPPRLTLAHGLMVLAALVTFVAVSAALRDRRATVEVLVAADDLDSGRVVDASDFTVLSVPASAASLDAWVGPLDEPSGQLARPLSPGEPLLRSDLVAVEDGLASRTFSIPVEDRVIDGLGLIVGDRVDVVGLTVDGLPSFVVGGVRVVRLPAASTGSSLSGRLGPGFVTVEVDERQVLALVTALRVEAVDVVRSTGAAPVAVRTKEAQ